MEKFFMTQPPYYLTAYGIAVKNGFVGTEQEWLESLKGATGAGFEIAGEYATLEELEQAVPDPVQGPAYKVGNDADYLIYGWSDSQQQWVPVDVRGPAGPQGPQGQTGPAGKDGAQGPAGPAGQDGAQGPAGPAGADGKPGEDGGYYKPAVDGAGNITFSPSKTGMPAVASANVRGPQGPTGPQGPQGPPGEDGASFRVEDIYETIEQLREAFPEGNEFAYAVGTAERNEVYIWSETQKDWVSLGALQGPVGPQGPAGQDGSQGPAGADGAQGPAGPAGADGQPGENGGYYTPSVDGEGNITFTASKAGMPPVTGANIRGPAGQNGVQGPQGPAGADGAPGPTGPQGEPGQDATINGVTTMTLKAAGGIKGTQSGSTYTFDGSDLVQKVSGAVNGNIPTLTADGQLQDSGKSLDDLGNNDFVVTITGSSAEGPFTADQQYANIVAAIAAGKNVYASWDAGSKKYPCIPLTVSPGSSNPSGKLAFTTFDLSYGVGPVAFMISSANAVTGFIQSQHTHTSANITDTIPVAKGGTGVTSLTGTDYNTSRVRGIALLSSTPSSIPNGCLVGVYE